MPGGPAPYRAGKRRWTSSCLLPFPLRNLHDRRYVAEPGLLVDPEERFQGVVTCNRRDLRRERAAEEADRAVERWTSVDAVGEQARSSGERGVVALEDDVRDVGRRSATTDAP